MLKFVGVQAVWDAIEEVGTKGGKKTGAIAWVSSSNRISFGAGDRLVVDASDHAIRQGLTRAKVLRRAFERGAELRSCSGLHAKVVVMGRTLVVGSMNSSGRSDGSLAEAARRDVTAHRSVNIGKVEAGVWKRLFKGTVGVLVERRFDRHASTLRLVRLLLPASGHPPLVVTDIAEGLLSGE
ncbi:hypothetical protein [Dongia sp.]|uniref:hypothetical protein n=1 Tax=Dongia sp. TaxID=1977262 RepID=UPI003752D5CE